MEEGAGQKAHKTPKNLTNNKLPDSDDDIDRIEERDDRNLEDDFQEENSDKDSIKDETIDVDKKSPKEQNIDDECEPKSNGHQSKIEEEPDIDMDYSQSHLDEFLKSH